jgi:hypothetical protein
MVVELRGSVSKYYFEWLKKNDFLSHFESPQTIERFCYTQNIPEDLVMFLETIFAFLAANDVLEESNSTYSIKGDLNFQNRKFENIEKLSPRSPVHHFLQRGINLFEERIEGGSGSLSSDKDKYLLERLLSIEELSIRDASELNFSLVTRTFPRPSIGVYSYYPQVCASYFSMMRDMFSRIGFISPNFELRDQTISYFEFVKELRDFSPVVILRNDVSDFYDVLIVPNGFHFDYSNKEQIQFFKKLLSPNGYLIIRDELDPGNIIGFEPFLLMQSETKDSGDHTSLQRLLKSSGFKQPTSIQGSTFFITQKE